MSSKKNIIVYIDNEYEENDSNRPTVYKYDTDDGPLHVNIVNEKQRRAIPPVIVRMYCPYCEKIEYAIPRLHTDILALFFFKLLFIFGFFSSLLPFFFRELKCNTHFCTKCGKRLLKTSLPTNKYRYLKPKKE